MTPLRVHDLRHVFAAIIAEKGGDLADIATLLGHTNLSTTLRYRSLVRVKATRLLDLV
jgi:site-specific recombinase XerD